MGRHDNESHDQDGRLMVGIIGGGLASSVSLDAMGLDEIPSGTFDVASSSIGNALAQNPIPRLLEQGGDMIN